LQQIERCLVIREPWISMILRGEKTWEMRSKPTSVRGPIGLVAQGTGMVVGAAVLADSLPPLSRANYMQHQDRHGIPSDRLEECLAQGWTHPWVLDEVRAFERPVPYAHNPGAVTFVILDQPIDGITLSREIAAATSDKGAATVASTAGSPEPIHRRASFQPGSPAERSAELAMKPSQTDAAEASVAAPLFHFRPEKAHARGRPTPDGFVVLAGSTVMRNGAPRVKRDRADRDQLVRRGILAPHTDPDLLVFSRDHVFSSASKAAGVV
jgi:hypothetical protein